MVTSRSGVAEGIVPSEIGLRAKAFVRVAVGRRSKTLFTTGPSDHESTRNVPITRLILARHSAIAPAVFGDLFRGGVGIGGIATRLTEQELGVRFSLGETV